MNGVDVGLSKEEWNHYRKRRGLRVVDIYKNRKWVCNGIARGGEGYKPIPVCKENQQRREQTGTSSVSIVLHQSTPQID